MRNWSKDEITEIFDRQGKLKKIRGRKREVLTGNNPAARVELVKNTRKHVATALKSIFKHEKRIDRHLRMPPKGQYMGIAEDFTSKEEILGKLSEGCVHSIDRRRSNQELIEQRERFGQRFADEIFVQHVGRQIPWFLYDEDW